MPHDDSSSRSRTTYRAARGAVVCARLAEGASVEQIIREPGMPCRATLRNWKLAHPDFAAQFEMARAQGGGMRRGGRPEVYSPELAEAVLEGLAEGRALHRICGEPGAPSMTTVFRWLKADPEFAGAYRLAREVQAHRLFDEVGEVAAAATSRTAYLARVRIDALKWQAARLAPRRFGPKPDDEESEGGGLTVIVRRFGDGEAPEAGG